MSLNLRHKGGDAGHPAISKKSRKLKMDLGLVGFILLLLFVFFILSLFPTKKSDPEDTFDIDP